MTRIQAWTCPFSVPVLPGAVGAAINAVMIRLFLTFLLILQLALSPALAHVPRDPGNMQRVISETDFSVEIPGINLQRWTQQVRDTIDLVEASTAIGFLTSAIFVDDVERQAMRDLMGAMSDDPQGFVAAVGQQIYDDLMLDIEAGDHASAVGRLSGTAVDVFLGAKGLTRAVDGIRTAALRNVGEVGGRNGGLLWGSWNDYPKVTIGGRSYAQIGNRQYSRHAVDRMQPSGLETPVGADGPGRNVTPNMVEEVIGIGTQTTTIVGGVERTIFRSGNVSVVTENGGNTIVTILRHSSSP